MAVITATFHPLGGLLLVGDGVGHPWVLAQVGLRLHHPFPQWYKQAFDLVVPFLGLVLTVKLKWMWSKLPSRRES